MTSQNRLIAATVAAAAMGLLAGLILTSGAVGDPGISDTGVYRGYGERIAKGDIPYRTFSVEYPPGALVPFLLPALVSSSHDRYDKAFQALMVVSLGIVCVLIAISSRALHATPSRAMFSVASFAVGAILLGPFTLTRFDYYAAIFTTAAVCAILHGRRSLGPILLGLAVATKIYPAVLLPLLLARTWKQGGRSETARAAALVGAVVALVYAPFALVSPDGVVNSVWRQLGRPLQIESAGSAVLLALHHAAGMPLAWASASGSQNLTGTVSAVAAGITTVVGLAALGLVWVRFGRGDTDEPGRFVQSAAAAIVAFVAFGKVLSPQFLVWLLAIVVLVPGLRGTTATLLLLTACLLTRAWFPHSYWELVKQFDPTASWLVLVRDVVLVGVFAVLVARLRAREPELP